ncbi:MAG: hypothetical protein KKF41_09610 [Actinobacteria bacterium]|nr:hypothetical protein [Actinomycetota bacterium]MBU1945257.1 hypothetical protein [Actinomycetota bacterium]MBU2687829.1 hypothetical protein [Actinomycetota bacterium]
MRRLKSGEEVEVQPKTGTVWRAMLIALAVVVVLAAFGIVAGRLGELAEEPAEALELLSSVSALLAVSFIFLDMTTGSFRPLLNRVFKPGRLQSAHNAFGLVGFSLALCHFLFLLPAIGEHYEEANRALFFFGPAALVLLALTIVTALLAARLSHSWRVIHLLNYVIFGIAMLHALVIGEDRSTPGMLAFFIAFGTVALAGLIYRLAFTDWRVHFGRVSGSGGR